ncbi:hypothetical protein KY285_018205 [Solanum tuberosum]|nr:hypothetical protein KY284_018197 [Solanum tuberosum]KAH0703927.1 hypothetical protein KY285_018205 [Solanum tuberosum]
MDNNFSSAKTLVAETVGEEINEERVKMDIKNPQEAERGTNKGDVQENLDGEDGYQFLIGRGDNGGKDKEDGAELDIDFSSVKVMVTEKVDEEIKEEGADVDTNNPTEEECFGNHLPCNSNYA